MKTRKINRYTRGKGVARVCRTPDFILKLKGKRCGKSSPYAADCFGNALVSRCRTLENREIMRASQLLLDIRSEGAERLAKINNDKDILSSIPAPYSEDTPIAIRANRHNATLRETQNQNIRRETEFVCNDDIYITSVRSALRSRINQIRNDCKKKISAFVMGVRMGADNDYQFIPEFTDVDLSAYSNEFDKIDSSVHKVANETYYNSKKEGTV